MRQLFATLLATSTLGGCSLIYNPSDLPGVPIDARIPIDAAPDAAPDAEPDAPPVAADPTALRITSVQPAQILEGQGAGGSQPQYLFIEGTDIVDGAAVTLVPDPATAGVDITVGPPVYASDHHSIAVPLTVHVMPTLANTDVALKVRVEQPGHEKFDEGKFIILHTLPEFALAGIQPMAPTVTLYSQIKIPAATRYEGTQKVVLRAIADISVVGNFDVSAPRTVAASTAAVTAPGPGGTAGGAGGSGLTNSGTAAVGSPAAGGGGGGASNGTVAGGGGGGGYAMSGGAGSGATPAAVGGSMTGEPSGLLLPDLEANHGAGGGGGGKLLTSSGGAGGGGGGSLVLAAGGDLTVSGAVLAKGANGAAGADGNGRGGGGGSGGTILLRAGGTLSVPTRSAAGGAAGDATAGAGSPGRIRIDSQMASGADRHGLTIVRPAITVGNLPSIAIQVRGANGDKFRYYVRKVGVDGAPDAAGTINSSNISIEYPVMLKIGLNEICVTNDPGTLDVSFETQDCIQVVNIPIF